MRLLGRDAELAACLKVLQGRTTSAGVLLVGEPGIGKTVMHRTVVDVAVASGWRALSTTGLVSEVAVPFANLADLLEPDVVAVLDRLADVQADALRAVLRMAASNEAPDVALIVRATVNALRALAGKRLLIAVDDEQWLDPDSRRLLSTAAVWLIDARIVWLVTVRPSHAEEGLSGVLAHRLGTDLIKIPLAGLSGGSLSRLILDRFPGRWSPRLLQDIVGLAAGNPYTALEVARETAAVSGHDADTARLPAGLTQSLRARLSRLAPETLAMAQMCCLHPRPTRALLRCVLGEATDVAVDDALEADVLASAPPDPVLRFTHPLLREVIQASMTAPMRRRVHRAFAAAVDDPDEAAGHLAAGAEEPDDGLAEVVAAASERVLAQGAPVRAAALAESAVALTPDQEGIPAWRRRLIQLECLKIASEWDRCRALAEMWVPDVPAELRGELIAQRAEVEPDFDVRVVLRTQAARELEHNPLRAAGVNAELAFDVGLSLLRLSDGLTYIREAVRQAHIAGDPVVVRTVEGYEGFLAYLAGDPEAGVRIGAAVAKPGLDKTRQPYQSPEMCLGWWHMCRGEVDAARRLFQTVREASERCGAEESAVGARLHLAEVEWRAGRWQLVDRHAAAQERYARETGYEQPGSGAYVIALHAASVGDVERARSVATVGLQGAEAQRDWTFAAQCRFVLGQLELSLDDPVAALGWLRPISLLFREHGFVEPGLFPFPPDLVEAYARVGRISDAEEQLRWLHDAAEKLKHPWARITSARATAVLHLARRDPRSALESASAAVHEARKMTLPFEYGRCLLVLGTAQRRTRRRREAARTLDEAIDVFQQLGAPCWKTLAQAQSAQLAHSAQDELTPAEQRVAELVARGLTNSEIAASMQISPKTVEANLTRIYRKLGVRGRVELVRRSTS